MWYERRATHSVGEVALDVLPLRNHRPPGEFALMLVNGRRGGVMTRPLAEPFRNHQTIQKSAPTHRARQGCKRATRLVLQKRHTFIGAPRLRNAEQPIEFPANGGQAVDLSAVRQRGQHSIHWVYCTAKGAFPQERELFFSPIRKTPGHQWQPGEVRLGIIR